MNNRHLLLIAGITLGIITRGSETSAKKLELVVSPVKAEKESNSLIVTVDSVKIEGSSVHTTSDSIFVQCGRSQDALPWMATFARSDSLKLAWTQLRPAGRNLVVAGGKPEEVELAVPAEGIERSCSCAGKRDTRTARFAATLTTSVGQSGKSVHLRGGQLGLFERLFIFRKGKSARPPKQFTITIETETANTQPRNPQALGTSVGIGESQ